MLTEWGKVKVCCLHAPLLVACAWRRCQLSGSVFYRHIWVFHQHSYLQVSSDEFFRDTYIPPLLLSSVFLWVSCRVLPATHSWRLHTLASIHHSLRRTLGNALWLPWPSLVVTFHFDGTDQPHCQSALPWLKLDSVVKTALVIELTTS